MDSLESNSSDQYKRTQKISYQTFLQEQKVKLKLRYPFLTKDQINKKAKDLWNHMRVNEKQLYTKTVLKKSPPPSTSKSASKTPVTKPRQKKKQVSKKRWQGFRNLENEFEAGYENDFMSDSPRNTLSKTVDEDLSWLTVENESDISAKNTKTFHKSRCQVNQKVPEIIQTTPHTPQGILKARNGETSAEKSNQARVSFSSENFQTDIDTYSDLTQNTYSQDSSDDEYSSKLLRRNEDKVFDFDGESAQNTPNEEEIQSDKENKDGENNKEVTVNQTKNKSKRKLRDKGGKPLNDMTLTLCETNDKETTLKPDLLPDGGEMSDSKSSEEETSQNKLNSPNTRSRSKASKESNNTTFKKPRLSKIGVKNSEEKLNSSYDSDETSRSKLGQGTQEKDEKTFKSPNTRSKGTKPSNANTFKKPRLSGTDELKENVELFSNEGKAVSKTSEIQIFKENTFKSPIIRAKATRQSNLKPSKAKAFKSPGIRSMTVQPEQHATPITDIHVNDNINKYTTPLMDESVQQLLLKDVEKAPKKKSQTQNNICEEASLSPLQEKQELITKTKARTSLIGKKDLCQKSEAENGIMGPTGDATFCQDMIMKKLEEKMNNKDFSGDNYMNLEGKDCVKKRPNSESVLINNDKKRNRVESYLLKESSPFISDNYSDSVDENSNSEESQLSEELIKDSQRTNQALVKALLKMKQVVAGAASPEVASVGSSPKLLSPALSGISQLSDMSSESDYTKSNDDPIKLASTTDRDNSNKMKHKDTLPDAKSAACSNMSFKKDTNEDGILCQMFEESTSKVPQNIFYTRKRLISSYQSEGNNFTHMFSEDDPFL